MGTLRNHSWQVSRSVVKQMLRILEFSIVTVGKRDTNFRLEGRRRKKCNFFLPSFMSLGGKDAH